MPKRETEVETLSDLRQRLSAAPSYPWQHLANWIEETEPYIVAHFGTYMDQFRRLTQKPPSTSYPMAFGKNKAENEARVQRFNADREATDKKNYGESKARLISFLDGVIRAEQHKQVSEESIPPRPESDEAIIPMIAKGPPIFISHASKDHKLANAFADLLQLTCDLQQKDIFCTSVDGMSIPNGSNFVDVIRERLVGSKLVVFLLSQAYFDSEFCLTELGAAWAMATRPLFLIVPPIDYSDLKGVLQNLQAGKINEPSHLTHFREALESALELKKTSGARWEAKRTEFLAIAKDCIDSQAPRKHISAEQHKALEDKYTEAMSELQKAYADTKALAEKYALLESKKDKADVKAVDDAFSPVPTEAAGADGRQNRNGQENRHGP